MLMYSEPPLKFRLAAAAALVSVLVWPATLAWRSMTRGYVLVDDVNGDHRPDRWRVYDAAGRLVRVARDTNFDGTADVEEYYQEGIVVRREIDRNFDGRTDQIEEIDSATGDRVVVVQDLDFDGAADSLVLLHNAHPVLRKLAARRTGRLARHRRSASADQLLALDNPFALDATLRPSTDADQSTRLGTASKLLIGVRAREAHGVASCPLAEPQTAVRRTDVTPFPARGPPDTYSA